MGKNDAQQNKTNPVNLQTKQRKGKKKWGMLKKRGRKRTRITKRYGTRGKRPDANTILVVDGEQTSTGVGGKVPGGGSEENTGR